MVEAQKKVNKTKMCDICGKLISNANNLISHKRNHSATYECRYYYTILHSFARITTHLTVKHKGCMLNYHVSETVRLVTEGSKYVINVKKGNRPPLPQNLS